MNHSNACRSTNETMTNYGNILNEDTDSHDINSNVSMKYKQKWFYKDEWAQNCKNDKSLITTYAMDNKQNNKQSNSHERALPTLLLNYFIVYGYEEAAIKMAKELHIIKSNKHSTQFNDLYMIKQRNNIKNMILRGNINSAISLIDDLFGLRVLQSNDLYFKLLLLNLIEMIRNNSYDIVQVIQYTRTHLAPRASQSKSYMQDLQSVISLLMLTAASSSSSQKLDISKLPTNLQNLYSIKLRNKLAHSINMKLLQIINVSVSNQSVFPNLILSNTDSFLYTSNNNIINNINNRNTPLTHILKNCKNTESQNNNNVSECSELTITDQNKYWQETKKYLKLNTKVESSSSMEEETSPFEAKLVQLMKLWIYSENELHSKGYGIPRVEDN